MGYRDKGRVKNMSEVYEAMGFISCCLLDEKMVTPRIREQRGASGPRFQAAA